MTTRIRLALLAGTTLFATAALTGCAIGLAPAESGDSTAAAPATTAPAAPVDDTETDTEDDQTPPTPTTTGEPTVVEAADTFTGATDGEYISGSCGDDPSAVTDLVITASNSTYLFDGYCGAITIEGDGVYLSVDTASSISIAGDNSSILAETVSTAVTVTGDGNYVYWGEGIATGKATNSGTGNVLLGA